MALSIFILLLFSIFSFNSSIYWLLVNKTGVGIAYVVDQLLPFGIAFLVYLFFLKKNKINPLLFFKSHRWSLSLLIIIAFFVHRWILGFYFFSEDPTTVLAGALYNDDRLITSLKGYPFSIYVASFLLFGTKVWFYNLVTLILFTVLVVSLYFLIYALLKKRFPAFIGTLFFITTPSYLTMFNWQSNAPGMCLALVSGILSLLSLLQYQKTKILGMYFLSVLFFIATMKMGFGRTAGLIALPLCLIFFPIFSSRINIKKSILIALPYVTVWLLMLSIVFFIPGGIFQRIISGNLSQISRGGAETLHLNNYLSSLAVWTSYLSYPNQISLTVFPFLTSWDQHISHMESIVVIYGKLNLLLMSIITVFSFFNLKKMHGKIFLFSIVWIVSNIFLLPLLIISFHNLSTIDSEFKATLIYAGPGKYIFYSSVGISILISIFTFWMRNKNKKIFFMWIIFLFVLIITNAQLSKDFYATRRAEIPQVRIVPDKVFSMVPRDGKKKLLFSTNPIRNAIDNQTGTYGVKWLNSFYSLSELSYINDRETFEKLIQSGEYKKENVYAFYNNPATLEFVDVSELIRKELFNKSVSKGIPIIKSPIELVSKILPSGLDNNNYPWILQRGVFVSPDLNYRFVLPKRLVFSIQKNDNTHPQLPYLDAIVTDKSNQETYFPQTLWHDVQNPPLISDKDGILNLLKIPSFDNKPIYAIDPQDKLNIANILKERESIRLGTKVSVSNIYPDVKINKDSLVDGIFIHDPPKDYERYFNAKTTPTKITLDLPYETVLGRILLNVPPSNLESLPTDIQIYSSKNKQDPIGSLQTTSPPLWSPNKGNLYAIPLNQIELDSLEIDVRKTVKAPIVLDEIIADPPQALAYHPNQIYELGNLNLHYVDSDTLLEKLLSLQKINTLTAFYACAESNDWNTQKKEMFEPVPDIWKANEIPMDSLLKPEELTLPIDCYGSVLRKLILIGPPYPSKITVTNMVLE